MYYSREPSIRTRIETESTFKVKDYFAHIRENHPLEQGLKQPVRTLRAVRISHIRENHPLEQGLKHRWKFSCPPFHAIRENHPLEQGLKRNPSRRQIKTTFNSREPSIRTRIETSI